MAQPDRHFKIRFNLVEGFSEVFWQEQESFGIVGLFNFVKRGMKFSYDNFVDDNYDALIIDESGVEQLPNGTWTGVVGLLNRSEVDYAPAEILLTEEGWDAAAYNYPYACDELTFLTQTPEYSSEVMALFRTLSLNVWLYLLASIILVTLVCFVAMKHRCSVEDILLHVFAIALNQEGNLVPKKAGEILLLSTWLGAMAVFTLCFKSVLLAFLAFPPLGGVRTVPELATAIRAGQYIAYSNRDIDFGRYLQKSPNENLRVVGESMLKTANYDLNNFKDFLRQKYPIKAFVQRRSYLAFANGNGFISKDNMGSLYFATAVRKNFCCKDEMDMLVHRFLAAGISHKIESFRNHKFAIHVKPASIAKDKDRKLTMTDLSGAFIILVAGHCVSVFVLIIECWIKHRQSHSSTRKKQSGAV